MEVNQPVTGIIQPKQPKLWSEETVLLVVLFAFGAGFLLGLILNTKVI